MFENLTYGHLLVVLLAALFILGPERLPEAATWLARAIGQIREFANGAREQLQRELGSDLAELRKPIEELRQPLTELRGYDPRRALTRMIFDEERHNTPHPPLRPVPATRPAPGERPPIDREAT